ncbi:PREDICTED: uncharacterized protein LOC104798414 [Tarenaya hassleriana]|uniref:uncharacterized protein LOC104798414 n=1 Tax=Tarenaya hassleriana TaxID=28532 RepID=UPI00053C3F64|nr:PREDICTED: uncharacterized protein LOC104798414 [Tarenaya hassleriana]
MVKETKGNVSRVISNGGGMEANTLAILDANDAKHTIDANEDRLQYLEAVRGASLLPGTGIPPTNKMYQAIFRILRFGRTLELIVASFQLLTELHKRFPWVYMSDSTAADGQRQLEIVDEAWSPFDFGSGVDSGDKEIFVTSSGFQKLIQDLTEAGNGIESQELDTKVLGNMLLFQFLVNVLEEDFTPRNRVYKETMNWNLLKESSLNLLLASRKINFKLLMKDCLSTVCTPCIDDAVTDSNEDPECSVKNSNTCLEISLVERKKSTLCAMKKLIVTIMELDVSKQKADLEGITTRGDSVRTPALDLIVNELAYDEYLLSTFLQVFDDPKWKLDIILQYLAKYIHKPSVRTRRSNSPPAEDSTTLGGVLKCLSNGTTARSITRKIGADIIQILIGHAFLAWLASNSFQQEKDASEPKEGNSVTDMCSSVIAVFTNLKQMDRKIEILPFGNEALFTAITILNSGKS